MHTYCTSSLFCVQTPSLHPLTLHWVLTLTAVAPQMSIKIAPRGTKLQQVTHQTVFVTNYILFPSVPHHSSEINFLLLCSSFLSLSEGNSEEVQVGKISFTPSDVIGHGTAGTFVFRYCECVHVCVFFIVYHMLKQCCFMSYLLCWKDHISGFAYLFYIINYKTGTLYITDNHFPNICLIFVYINFSTE